MFGRSITRVYSSPCRRAVLTVEPLARALGLAVELREDLRERQIGAWVDDFREYYRRQWDDFDYRLDGGESLRQAQSRNIAQVQVLIEENLGKSITVGTHGTALSLILNYYDSTFDVHGFEFIVDRMPWVVVCHFHGTSMTDWQEIDLG
jgi:2,3-bisphosphoglycerate-dependent phosphoglycerate mutase